MGVEQQVLQFIEESCSEEPYSYRDKETIAKKLKMKESTVGWTL